MIVAIEKMKSCIKCKNIMKVVFLSRASNEIRVILLTLYFLLRSKHIVYITKYSRAQENSFRATQRCFNWLQIKNNVSNTPFQR